MAHNIQRTERMKSKTVAQLREMVKAKTLASAAAAYELRRRGLEP